MKQKHGLLLFISSCIPGCGQMHQGYMKRGVSLLLAFCGIFAVAIFLEIGALAVLMLPIWLYAFFDSYNLRGQISDGFAPADEFLFGLSDMDSVKLSALCRKRHSIIGWCLVALGVWILYTTAADWLFELLDQFFYDSWWLHRILVYDIPRVIVTAGIILLGVWFIRRPRRAPAEEIPTFTPPRQDAPSSENEEAPHGES